MEVKKMKAAPAANTPLLNIWQEGGVSVSNVLYLVWYAFLADPANKQISAMKKNTLKQIISQQ